MDGQYNKLHNISMERIEELGSLIDQLENKLDKALAGGSEHEANHIRQDLKKFRKEREMILEKEDGPHCDAINFMAGDASDIRKQVDKLRDEIRNAPEGTPHRKIYELYVKIDELEGGMKTT